MWQFVTGARGGGYVPQNPKANTAESGFRSPAIPGAGPIRETTQLSIRRRAALRRARLGCQSCRGLSTLPRAAGPRQKYGLKKQSHRRSPIGPVAVPSCDWPTGGRQGDIGAQRRHNPVCLRAGFAMADHPPLPCGEKTCLVRTNEASVPFANRACERAPSLARLPHEIDNGEYCCC